MNTANDTIRVKLVGKHRVNNEDALCRQFPDGVPTWGRCSFVFDHDEPGYDWLVVYDELPPEGLRLACPSEHTMLVTTEPASIKVYGRAYLGQFAHVLTSQEPWAINHPGVIRSQPGLFWYYGMPLGGDTSGSVKYNQIKHGPYADKDLGLSTVCSNKAMGHTLHRLRYDFTQKLKAAMPEADVFGRGVRDITDKAQAMDRYKYHLAIENHVAPHHITEKLTDTFLSGALPFYFGAPNAADYFPPESFIPIDIRNTEQAIAQIRQAMLDGEYEKRLDAIQEARRRTLDEHNIFPLLAKQIERLDTGQRGGDGARVYNRRALRRRNPIGAVRYLVERYTVQAKVRKAMRG